MEKNFETADLYLSAAICVPLSIYPTFKVENKMTLFVFPACDEVYEAINGFNNGAKINAYEYAQMIKRLRAEIIMRRGK